jgi:hypothetical protein
MSRTDFIERDVEKRDRFGGLVKSPNPKVD